MSVINEITIDFSRREKCCQIAAGRYNLYCSGIWTNRCQIEAISVF